MPLSKEQIDFLLRKLPAPIDVTKVQQAADKVEAVRTELLKQKLATADAVPAEDTPPVVADEAPVPVSK